MCDVKRQMAFLEPRQRTAMTELGSRLAFALIHMRQAWSTSDAGTAHSLENAMRSVRGCMQRVVGDDQGHDVVRSVLMHGIGEEEGHFLVKSISRPVSPWRTPWPTLEDALKATPASAVIDPQSGVSMLEHVLSVLREEATSGEVGECAVKELLGMT